MRVGPFQSVNPDLDLAQMAEVGLLGLALDGRLKVSSQFISSGGFAVRHHPPDRSPSYRSEPIFRPLSQVRVVLHYAHDRSLMDVYHAIMELTRFGREEAIHRMWQSYHGGQTVLMETHLEKAELLVERFAGRGLPVTMEQA